jgi:hypothetical protein
VIQCKFIIKYRIRIWNFIEFIRFFQKGFNPFKIHGRFKFEFIPEFITCNPLGFELDPKSKVASCVPSYQLAKFGKIWTSGKSPIRISKCGCLKILINQKNCRGPLVSLRHHRVAGLMRVTAAQPRAGRPSSTADVSHVRRPMHPYPLRVVVVEDFPPTAAPPRALSPPPFLYRRSMPSVADHRLAASGH